jgi:hypothetical protein
VVRIHDRPLQHTVARRRLREALQLLAAAWVVRAAFIVAMPSRAHSADVDHWVIVARQLHEGLNPYATTTFLNWPPLWLVVISLLDHVSRAAGISFFLALRLFLVAVESCVIVIVYVWLSRIVPRDARRLVLVGLCLNPVAILLTCQHGNFDVLVGLFATIGALALAQQARSKDTLVWLAASLAFGVAALAKTVALALAPLLARPAALSRPLGRLLGATLFVGPPALGIAVLLALAPHAVVENVIQYRSSPGYFGITGLLSASGFADGSSAYTKVLFPVAVAVVLVVSVSKLWHHELDGPRTLLLAALVLLAIPSLGPGYAPQYAYWWLPLFITTYPLFDERWRKTLLAFYAVVALTYLIEYALIPSQGAFLDVLFPHSSQIGDISAHLAIRGWQTLARLPLFVASLLVLAAGVERLRARPL